jgi:hypothetical protein
VLDRPAFTYIRVHYLQPVHVECALLTLRQRLNTRHLSQGRIAPLP